MSQLEYSGSELDLRDKINVDYFSTMKLENSNINEYYFLVDASKISPIRYPVFMWLRVAAFAWLGHNKKSEALTVNCNVVRNISCSIFHKRLWLAVSGRQRQIVYFFHSFSPMSNEENLPLKYKVLKKGSNLNSF